MIKNGRRVRDCVTIVLLLEQLDLALQFPESGSRGVPAVVVLGQIAQDVELAGQLGGELPAGRALDGPLLPLALDELCQAAVLLLALEQALLGLAEPLLQAGALGSQPVGLRFQPVRFVSHQFQFTFGCL